MKYDKSNKTEHDIKKDGLDESQPSGGKSAEEVERWYRKWMADRGKSGIATVNILDMLKDFACQYAHQQPDGAVDALECTCKLTDKNHALCPVCDKEEYKKSVEQRNDAIKNVDERTTNKELISFLISPKKPFKINIVRDLFNQYYQEEISLSRLNERLNEIVFYWKQPVHGYSMEQVNEAMDKIETMEALENTMKPQYQQPVHDGCKKVHNIEDAPKYLGDG